jgi:hypothetical protein
MSEKRYQVFLSSTFIDLKEERQAVLEAILELRHIPAGMEIFPAADSTPWELIKRIINDSDYYVLIVGGRYGSVDASGLSYTEREYELAVELKKPVLPFLHADPSMLPVMKSDIEKETRERLQAFRKRVDSHHTRKYWNNIGDLKANVIIALTWAIQTHPAIGWVRAQGYDDEELLRRLTNLQERFDAAQSEIATLRRQMGEMTDASGYSQGDEKIDVSFYLDWVDIDKDSPKTPTHVVRLSWDEIFFGLGLTLMSVARYWDLREAFKPIVFGAISGSPEFAAKIEQSKRYSQDPQDKLHVTRATLQLVLNQFAALGLVEPQVITLTNTTDNGRTYTSLEHGWRLTTKGQVKYFSAVAVRKDSASIKALGG